ncbi:unnamed protein product [Parnassius apollo]|uniref:(apollo) hypothetical protein n=1 Tax=Parnassius apollo TaxID=110799 RepID=A0A8S3XEU6_PARAO|nr:unnamed protein product [Parnassius apollo]
MEISIFSSDSDDSDLDVLAQLSDWDTDSDAEDRHRASSQKLEELTTCRAWMMPSSRLDLADFVGVSISTAGRIVRDISSAIANLYDEYILVHQQSAEKFYRIEGFPRVLASIDCTHIQIQSSSQCDVGLFGNRWMLSDGAYPNRPYLLTPIINPVTEAEKRYNEAHIKNRNVIERSHNLEVVPSEVELPTAEINDEVYYTELQDASERAALINNYFI